MKNYEIKQAFKNLPDAGRPDNETVACHEYRQCEGCNYPAHGFICWHGDGKCLRTEMREVKQGLVDPDIFISKTNELTEQLRTLKVEKERLVTAESDDAISQRKLLIEILNDRPYILDDFDEELFGELVDKISINSNHIMFRLRNGLELKETIAGEG